jgi:hypothetical protein
MSCKMSRTEFRTFLSGFLDFKGDFLKIVRRVRRVRWVRQVRLVWRVRLVRWVRWVRLVWRVRWERWGEPSSELFSPAFSTSKVAA